MTEQWFESTSRFQKCNTALVFNLLGAILVGSQINLVGHYQHLFFREIDEKREHEGALTMVKEDNFHKIFLSFLYGFASGKNFIFEVEFRQKKFLFF